MTVPVVEVFVTFQTLAEADLTSYTKSVSISRGRSRQLDQFNAGTATVVFDNSTRVLDPLNTDSPYYPYVLPRAEIKITANEIPIFTGVVADWDLSYDITNNDEIVAICSDAFTVLANQALEFLQPVEQRSGARIDTVLDLPEVNYQGAVQIGAGSSDLGNFDVESGTVVLNYLQQITKTEQGFFYIAADGDLVFKGRTEVLNLSPSVDFNDDGTDIPYQSLSNEFGDEFLYNYIVTQTQSSDPFVASDTTSQSVYQVQRYSLTDLLYSYPNEAEALGEYLLEKFKNPEFRFTGLSNELSALSDTDQDLLCSVDLTDIVSVTKSFAAGEPSSVTKTVLVSGINHQIRPDSHILTFNFEPYTADETAYLLLGSSTNGIVGTNILAF